jgi:hypothetical protein
MRLNSTLCVILCRKVRLWNVMHLIMVEPDHNVMTPVQFAYGLEWSHAKQGSRQQI